MNSQMSQFQVFGDEQCKYSIRREGKNIVQDIGFTPIISAMNQIRLVSFFKWYDFFCVNGVKLVQRARGELKANLGAAHAIWILDHRKQIPAEFFKYALAFPGTITFKAPDFSPYMMCVECGPSGWYCYNIWLGGIFTSKYRLVGIV